MSRVTHCIAVAISSLYCELSSMFPRKYPLPTSLARNRSHPGPSHGRAELAPEGSLGHSIGMQGFQSAHDHHHRGDCAPHGSDTGHLHRQIEEILPTTAPNPTYLSQCHSPAAPPCPAGPWLPGSQSQSSVWRQGRARKNRSTRPVRRFQKENIKKVGANVSEAKIAPTRRS